jgi:hypothetical protein
MLFLRRKSSCLEATIWAHNCPSDLLGGCWRRGGVETTCSRSLQNRPKNRNPTESDRPTSPLSNRPCPLSLVCNLQVFFKRPPCDPLAPGPRSHVLRDKVPAARGAKKNAHARTFAICGNHPKSPHLDFFCRFLFLFQALLSTWISPSFEIKKKPALAWVHCTCLGALCLLVCTNVLYVVSCTLSYTLSYALSHAHSRTLSHTLSYSLSYTLSYTYKITSEAPLSSLWNVECGSFVGNDLSSYLHLSIRKISLRTNYR